MTGLDRPEGREDPAASRSARLSRAHTLRRLGRIYSARGSRGAAEEAFAGALRLFDELGDVHSFVLTLVQRGHHRLFAGEPAGGADWGTALALAAGLEARLTQHVVAATARWARDRCLEGRDDALLSAALAALTEAAEAAAETMSRGGPAEATLAVVLNAFRVIGAISAYHDGADPEEAAAYAAAARSGAAEVDRLTSGAFALEALVARRLP